MFPLLQSRGVCAAIHCQHNELKSEAFCASCRICLPVVMSKLLGFLARLSHVVCHRGPRFIMRQRDVIEERLELFVKFLL